MTDDRILTPIGMTDTFTREDEPAAARMATGHRQWFGRWRPADLPFDPAGIAYGYLGSSIEDLTRFLHAHLDDDSALVPATATQLAQDPVGPTGWDVPLESGQGLGWMVDDHAGHQVVSHAGSLGLALIAMILRNLLRNVPRFRRNGLRTTRGRRFWIRRIALPTAGYLGVAAVVLLAVPLATARHFYPDVGTAITVITYTALTWGLVRLPLTLVAPDGSSESSPATSPGAAKTARDPARQPLVEAQP